MHTEVITASADEHIFAIGAAVSERVAELNKDYNFWHVSIEDVMKSFAAGRFNTQGLFKLARLNGIVSFECWRRLDASMALVMPNAIRSGFDVKAALAAAVQGSGCDATNPLALLRGAGLLPEEVSAGLTETSGSRARKPSREEATKLAVLVYVASVFGPAITSTLQVTKTGSLHMTNYDRTDSILSAMHGCTSALAIQLLKAPEFFPEFAGACVRDGLRLGLGADAVPALVSAHAGRLLGELAARGVHLSPHAEAAMAASTPPVKQARVAASGASAAVAKATESAYGKVIAHCFDLLNEVAVGQVHPQAGSQDGLLWNSQYLRATPRRLDATHTSASGILSA